MGWWLAYLALGLALVVRFVDPHAPARRLPSPAPGDPLRLIAVHHGAFYALLAVVAPGEAALLGGAAAWRWAGLAMFALGVALYRAAGAALGEALSPFVEPAPGARLVTHGLYGPIRHPMYLGQALVALGAPLTLGCRYALALSAAAIVLLGVRARLEDAALRRTYPEYGRYASRAKRVVPFLL